MSPSFSLGTHLGRYEIKNPLDAGGMREVYLAQNTKLDLKIALKIPPADLAANQDRMRRFFQEEKASLWPNIDWQGNKLIRQELAAESIGRNTASSPKSELNG